MAASGINREMCVNYTCSVCIFQVCYAFRQLQVSTNLMGVKQTEPVCLSQKAVAQMGCGNGVFVL